MKKQIATIGTLAFLLLMSFGCEKKELATVEAEETKVEKFAVVTHVEDLKGNLEKAIIVGTKAELQKSLMGDRPATLKKGSERANILIPSVVGPVGPVGPVDPVDPHAACWDEIMAYHDAHIAEWKALANQTCEVLWRCITCPNAGGGLFMAFYIHPTNPRCNLMEAVKLEEKFTLNPFNFDEDDYESDQVLEFIRAAR